MIKRCKILGTCSSVGRRSQNGIKERWRTRVMKRPFLSISHLPWRKEEDIVISHWLLLILVWSVLSFSLSCLLLSLYFGLIFLYFLLVFSTDTKLSADFLSALSISRLGEWHLIWKMENGRACAHNLHSVFFFFFSFVNFARTKRAGVRREITCIHQFVWAPTLKMDRSLGQGTQKMHRPKDVRNGSLPLFFF